MSGNDLATPASGRGLQLSKEQEVVLIRIAQERQGTKQFKEHTKAFWLGISDLLREETGRVYSWQSCQRRMLAWESNFLHAPYIRREKQTCSPQEDVGKEIAHSPVSTEVVSESAISEESDNDLPRTPCVLRRGMNPSEHPVQREMKDLRCEFVDLVQCTMTSLEAQIKCLSNALVANDNSCEGVTDALEHLQVEVAKALNDYKRSA
jgi:hypothetical protein